MLKELLFDGVPDKSAVLGVQTLTGSNAGDVLRDGIHGAINRSITASVGEKFESGQLVATGGGHLYGLPSIKDAALILGTVLVAVIVWKKVL